MIPYRESNLTKVFQPYLSNTGGKMSLIYNLNPSSNLYEESSNSLDFCKSSQKIKQKEIGEFKKVANTECERAIAKWEEEFKIMKEMYESKLEKANKKIFKMKENVLNLEEKHSQLENKVSILEQKRNTKSSEKPSHSLAGFQCSHCENGKHNFVFILATSTDC